MQISARVHNQNGSLTAQVQTGAAGHAIPLRPKPSGLGAETNGGELLFLALATCFCNDLHREAARRSLSLRSVEVRVEGEFGEPGEPARNVVYHAQVEADAPASEIAALIEATDRVAEIHNTLRKGCPIRLQVTTT